MRKIYVVGGSRGYANWIEDVEFVDKVEDCDIVLYIGGEDIFPGIYGKKPHPTTMYNLSRDKYEIEIFYRAMDMGKKFLGICRGAQFLCAMSGGVLVQDQSHPYLHPIITNNGRYFITSSTHHQRQCIKGIEDKVELLAWAEHLSPYSFGESVQDDMSEDKECEIVFYNGSNSLAIQGHPEYLFPTTNKDEADFISYCRALVKIYLG